MLAPKERAEPIQQGRRAFAFERADHLTQDCGGRKAQEQVDVVFPAVGFQDFALESLANSGRIANKRSCRSAVSLCQRNFVRNPTCVVRW
jgi:hypothetical protein